MKRRPPAIRPVPFSAFIAYPEIAAGRDALGVINEVLRAAPQPHVLEPMLWRFDQLANPRWRARALADAARADVIVLASTAAIGLTPAVENWMQALLAQQLGRRTTIVALLGTDEAWTISIDQPAAVAETQTLVADLSRAA